MKFRINPSLACVILVLLSCTLFAAPAHAAPVSGAISFTGFANVDKADLSKATRFTAYSSLSIGANPSGDFAGTRSAAVAGKPFIFNPSTPLADWLSFTMTGNLYSFDATSAVVGQSTTSSFLEVSGTLIARRTGNEATNGTWRLTMQKSSATSTGSTFSLSINVPGAIGDFVWNDLNRNGVQDPGELGIQGVAVSISGGPAGFVPRTTVTDATGYYQFGGLLDGTYRIAVDLNSAPLVGLSSSPMGQGTPEADSNDPKSTSVTLIPAKRYDSTVDFGFYSPGTIGDFVWNDYNANGVQDSGEAGFDEVTVLLYRKINQAFELFRETTTARGGYYSFDQLPVGDYRVDVVPSGPIAGMKSSPAARGADVTADSNANPAFVTLTVANPVDNSLDFGFYASPTGEIGDYIWNDLDQDGVQGADEQGINGVTVTLRYADGNPVLDANLEPLKAVTYSDTQHPRGGYYAFTGLFAGEYLVEVQSGGPLQNFISTTALVGSDRSGDSNGLASSPCKLERNDSKDSTVDFGYIETRSSIGDFVWLDLNGDGIQDPNEAGIEKVPVKLRNSAGDEIATTTTLADGFYIFEGLRAGNYTVEVPTTLTIGGYTYEQSGANQGADRAKDSNDSGTVQLGVVDSRLDIDFGYKPKPQSRIGNFVWEDRNFNGVQDAGEPGIGGVTVELYFGEFPSGVPVGTVPYATVQTSTSGEYLFTDLRAGKWTVIIDRNQAALAGYLPTVEKAGSEATDSNSNPLVEALLTNTEDDLTIDFGFFKPAGKIGNLVWRDTNENGLQDINEAGIDGVTVKLLASDGTTVLATIVTGTAGNGTGGYLFTGLAKGTYTVCIDNNSLALAGLTPTDIGDDGKLATRETDSNGSPAKVTLPNHDTEDLTIDFGYIRPIGSIGDYVWLDTNGDGIQNNNESGIAGVKVRLTYTDGTPVLSAGIPVVATTDANGAYLFSGLRAGSYLVKIDSSTVPSDLVASPQNRGTSASDSNNPTGTLVALGIGGSETTIDFGYVPPARGEIGDFVWLDQDGNGLQGAGEPGIPGVTVVLTGPNGLTLTTTTDSSGAYLLTGLAAGSYTVTVNSATLPAGYTATATGVGGNRAIDSNGSPASVSLATNSSSDRTIDFGYKAPPPPSGTGPYTTFTMGGWGAKPSGSNPGTVLQKNFARVYPSGLTLGGKYTLKFTSQLGIQNFLPCGTTPRGLTTSYINPTTALGNLAGQVTALRLNVDFSNAGVLPAGLRSAKYNWPVGHPLANYPTAGQVLALAESVLGGGTLPPGVSYSMLDSACTLVNENYDNGVNGKMMTP